MNYYDIILVMIPLALLGLTGTLTVSGVALTTAVPLSAAVSAGLVGHAMFLRAPVEDTPTPAAA